MYIYTCIYIYISVMYIYYVHVYMYIHKRIKVVRKIHFEVKEMIFCWMMIYMYIYYTRLCIYIYTIFQLNEYDK